MRSSSASNDCLKLKSNIFSDLGQYEEEVCWLLDNAHDIALKPTFMTVSCKADKGYAFPPAWSPSRVRVQIAEDRQCAARRGEE